MVSKRRTYTREFKVKTVNLITGSDQSVRGGPQNSDSGLRWKTDP